MTSPAPSVALTDIPIRFDAEALARTAHVPPGGEDHDTFAGLVCIAQKVARPRALYRECFVDARGADTVTVGSVTFASRTLRLNLDAAERVFATVATCGPEMDTVPLPTDDMLAEFWWDTIKAAALRCAMEHLDDHLHRRYALGHTAMMSPGAADAETWPIEQQRTLFSLLGDVQGLIGVRLTDSCLMMPNKTVSGLVFPTESDFRSCQVCRREICPGRSAPFDHALWESMQAEG